MTGENIFFGRYENPQRAARIFVEYLPDIERLELAPQALMIVNRCDKSFDLDIRLDELVSEVPKKGLLVHIPADEDSNGSWGNAVRAYEEQ